jgi:hypothetical protein
MRLELLLLLLGQLQLHLQIPLLKLLAQQIQLAPERRLLCKRVGGFSLGGLGLVRYALHAKRRLVPEDEKVICVI